jgi:iron complex transport system substrate-binding protein
MTRRLPLALAAAGAAVLAATTLTACGSSGGAGGSTTSAGTPSGASSADAAAFPVSIPSALGTATIKSAPQRVVTLGWGSDDASLALGVTPVGMSINEPEAKDGITPWAEAAVKGATPTMFDASGDTLPFEKIAALHPDVILAVYSGITSAQYKTLTAIAPTVAYPDKAWSTSWTDQLELVGKALGRSAQATALEQKVTAQIAAAKAAHPEFAGKTAIFGSGTQTGSFNLYFPDDPRMQLLGQLGFTVSDAARTTFAQGGSVPSFANAVSLEQLPKLKTDVLVAWYLSAATQKSTEASPLFGGLAAVKDKAYVAVTDPSLLFATSAPNVLSIPWMLKTYVPLLAGAARNAG